MTDEPSLADLAEETEVLFVNPYNDKEIELIELAGDNERKIKKIYNQALARDPDFANFAKKVNEVKEKLGLDLYDISDDLVALHGDRASMKAAEKILSEEFTAFIDTLDSLLELGDDDEFEIEFIPDPKPVLH